ncbi:MAG TPA: GGDEF domain-containing protein, partial [Solirubrobacteraceae bacterium]|nr:GGDEF domain-containing protein [Solirubrobacteraceae bacterium]
VVSLYRPAFDDFLVSTVHGSEEARRTLLGTSRTLDQWTPLLDPEFEREGCFLLPWDEFDWSKDETVSYVPPTQPGDAPDAWHPEDALFVPLRHLSGNVLGFLSVDEPADRRRPSDDDLRVLAALAGHAAGAVQEAIDAAEAARHRTSLEHLLSVSARLTETTALEPILEAVCAGIRAALGFQNVSVELIDPGTGRAVPQAAVGWSLQELEGACTSHVSAVEQLLDPAFEVEGCFLLPGDEACARLGIEQPAYRTTRNGRGPHAWVHHWLVIPLRRADGSLLGVIWADEPEDRLLPARQRLQALRLFANQATTAVVSAQAFDEMRFLADHDPLTRLGNRRAFTRALSQEAYRAARYGRPFALVLMDLDDFKALNDRHGHAAGDAALVAVAAVLRRALRRTDAAFRLGGDEFALLLEGSGAEQARATTARIATALRALDVAAPETIGASFGIAVHGDDPVDPETLLSAADRALYAAKAAAAPA